MEVFARAKTSGRTPAEEASDLADELSQELHPIWGHRGQQIIDYLVKSGWERGATIRVADAAGAGTRLAGESTAMSRDDEQNEGTSRS